jgi:hypothetical protein
MGDAHLPREDLKELIGASELYLTFHGDDLKPSAADRIGWAVKRAVTALEADDRPSPAAPPTWSGRATERAAAEANRWRSSGSPRTLLPDPAAERAAAASESPDVWFLTAEAPLRGVERYEEPYRDASPDAVRCVDDAFRAATGELAWIAPTQRLRKACRAAAGVSPLLYFEGLAELPDDESHIFRRFVELWIGWNVGGAATVSGVVAALTGIQEVVAAARELRCRRQEWLRDVNLDDVLREPLP